jgi:hypothetical protein
MKEYVHKYICAVMMFGFTFLASLGVLEHWLDLSNENGGTIVAIIPAAAVFTSICLFWKKSAVVRWTATVITILLVVFGGGMCVLADPPSFAFLLIVIVFLLIGLAVCVFVGWLITELLLWAVLLVGLLLWRKPVVPFTWRTKAISITLISLILLFIGFTFIGSADNNHVRVQEIIETMKQADLLLVQEETREEGFDLLESIGFFDYADLQRPDAPAPTEVSLSDEAFFHSHDQRMFATTLVFDPELKYAKSLENPDMIDGRERYMPPGKRALPGMPNWPCSEFYRRVVEDYRRLKMSEKNNP